MSSLPLPVVDVSGCCSPAEPVGTRFHFSLNVSNLQASIAFYQVLFDVPPAKCYPDYAKFELSQPPLVFSLVPNAPGSGGTLSHFGFPVDDAAEVEAVARRLAAAGLETSCQHDTVCGYARQDKVWVADPDHNYWEIYAVQEEVEPDRVRSGFDGVPPRPSQATAGSSAPAPTLIWEQPVMAAFAERIPHDDRTVDEVRLQGSWNNDLTDGQRATLLAEARRVLKPGGKVLVHGLVADRPLAGTTPTLPGVAALVRRVPVAAELIRDLTSAGFEATEITRLAEAPVFTHGEVEMREIKISANNPVDAIDLENPRPGGRPLEVLYKGPFEKAVDEQGQEFVRGRRVPVSAQTWERLSRSAAAADFLFLGDPTRDDSACSTS